MALNKAVFKTRAITAIVFVAVMLVGLLWNRWAFVFLFTIIHFGCWYEFVKLMKKIYGGQFWLYSLLGLAYITMPIAMLINMRFSEIFFKGNSVFIDLGYLLPCAIIFSIWINDTMAYVVGSFIGKTPFSKISPKKTWEGTIGGALLAIIVVTSVGHYFFGLRLNICFGIAAIAAIIGTLGDLLESKLKRLANVKDSGSLMPGHGGFLDRFDSLLLATPFVWLFLQFFF